MGQVQNLAVAQNNDSIYRTFLQKNKLVWDDFAPCFDALEEKVILVDQLVEFPPYLLGNLIIAKYLQKKTNARLMALVRHPSHLERQTPLLQSFSVEKVFYADYDFTVEAKVDLSGILEAQDAKRLREKILEFTIDQLPVGDLLYDAYLRDMASPSIWQSEQMLVRHFHQAIRLYASYKSIFNTQRNIIATVQGHTSYLLYGLFARIAVNHGATVFGRKPGASPLAIKKYTKLNEFKRHEVGFRKEDFLTVWEHGRHQALEFAEDFLMTRLDGKSLGGTNPYVPAGFDLDRKRYHREEIAGKMGLNKDNPNVFLMCHAFCDTPHSYDRMLHNDYFEWIEDTLEIVSRIPDTNWIVKRHPEDKYFGAKQDHLGALISKYNKSFKHIFIAPDDMHTSSILEVADSLVTVRGTAGLEFSAFGIPCLVTGSSPYTGYGFTIEPMTREEYVEELKKIGRRKRLLQEQIEKARVCCYCYFYLDLVECAFIPSVAANWWSGFNAEDFWGRALSAIESFKPANDPLYHNFTYQLQKGLPHLMRFDEIPLSANLL